MLTKIYWRKKCLDVELYKNYSRRKTALFKGETRVSGLRRCHLKQTNDRKMSRNWVNCP